MSDLHQDNALENQYWTHEKPSLLLQQRAAASRYRRELMWTLEYRYFSYTVCAIHIENVLAN